MTTLEDILNPYERNIWFYIEDNEHLDIIPVEFYCEIYRSNHEITKDKKDNLKIKHYIKFGELCPICYEPIYFKKHALLGNCGHCFHNHCIFKRDEIDLYTVKQNKLGECPYCRQDMGLYECSNNRYQTTKGKNQFCDGVENYINNYNLTYSNICMRYTMQGRHAVGFDKNCYECLKYRNTGHEY